jgi:hypothetical protein
MHVVYICISALMNYDCITHPILPFITISQSLQSFLQNIALKGYLTQRWMTITVSILQKKLSYEVIDPKQPKMSNIHFDLLLKLSQGKVHDFSGEVKKFSGEVQSDLRGGAHFRTPPIKIRTRYLRYLSTRIGNSHYRLIFYLGKKKYIPGKSILKLVKLQNLVAKCCKMRKI